MLHKTGSRREKHIGRNRGDNNGIKIRRINAALGERFLSRFNSEIAGCNALVNNVTFPDAGAFQYPLIVGIDHLFEVGVSQKARRDVSTKSADLGAAKLTQ